MIWFTSLPSELRVGFVFFLNNSVIGIRSGDLPPPKKKKNHIYTRPHCEGFSIKTIDELFSARCTRWRPLLGGGGEGESCVADISVTCLLDNFRVCCVPACKWAWAKGFLSYFYALVGYWPLIVQTIFTNWIQIRPVSAGNIFIRQHQTGLPKTRKILTEHFTDRTDHWRTVYPTHQSVTTE